MSFWFYRWKQEALSELLDAIKNQTTSDGKAGEYGKKFMKIKIDTDNDLPLNKLVKL